MQTFRPRAAQYSTILAAAVTTGTKVKLSLRISEELVS